MTVFPIPAISPAAQAFLDEPHGLFIDEFAKDGLDLFLETKSITARLT